MLIKKQLKIMDRTKYIALLNFLSSSVVLLYFVYDIGRNKRLEQ